MGSETSLSSCAPLGFVTSGPSLNSCVCVRVCVCVCACVCVQVVCGCDIYIIIKI